MLEFYFAELLSIRCLNACCSCFSWPNRCSFLGWDSKGRSQFNGEFHIVAKFWVQVHTFAPPPP